MLYFFRLFGTRCEKCTRSFGPNDFVMRAKEKIFHLECFRCVACNKQLVPGEEFALRHETGDLYCKDDHASLSRTSGLDGLVKEENNNNDNDQGSGHGDLDEDDEDEFDKSVGGGEEDRLDRLADSGEYCKLRVEP